MALIGKIRDQSLLILIFIGIAILAFVLSDAFSGGGPRGGLEQESIGEIFGEEINTSEYKITENNFLNAQQQRARQSGQKLNAQATDYFKSQAWDIYLRSKILEIETNKAGLKLSENEMFDLSQGGFISPFIQQYFRDSTGQFNKELLLTQIPQLEASPQGRADWETIKSEAGRDRIWKKYHGMISQGLYVTTLEAQNEYLSQKVNKNIRYAVKKYTDIPDENITISDNDLKAFYNAHKNESLYEQPYDAREIEFVSFPIEPSEQDKAFAKQKLIGIKEKFEKATNDSLFVMGKSFNKFYTSNYQSINQFPEVVESLIIDADSGEVIDPFVDKDVYKMVKVIDARPKDEAKVKFIFLRKNNDGSNLSEISKRIDSLKNVVLAKDNFDQMQFQFSNDPAVRSGKNTIDWFGRDYKGIDSLVVASSFKGRKGDMRKLTADDGVYLINVLGRRLSKEVKMAVVDTKIKALEETRKQCEQRALTFQYDIDGKADEFKAIAEKDSLQVTSFDIIKNQKRIANLQNPGELYTWSFQHSEGEVSSPINTADQIVVACLKKIKSKGPRDFEDVKEDLRSFVLNEKKAEQIKQEITGMTDVNAIANQFNTSALSGNVSFSSSSLPNGGLEPDVIGKIFSMEDNTTSKAIEGRSGVYVVLVENSSSAAANADANYTIEKQQLLQRRKQNIEGSVFNALKEKANIVDKRSEIGY